MLHPSAIEVFEAFLGVKLPSDYANYLLKNNGGTPANKYFDIPGEGYDLVNYFFALVGANKQRTLSYAMRNYKGRVPDEMLPIGNDPGGNLLLLTLKGKMRGKVSFWDHEREADEEPQPFYENIKTLAPSFDAFLKKLKPVADPEP